MIAASVIASSWALESAVEAKIDGCTAAAICSAEGGSGLDAAKMLDILRTEGWAAPQEKGE